MTAGEIAAALGAARRSGGWWRCLCPVHGSRTGRSATLALRDGEHGLVAICHAGCDRAEVRAELRRRGLLYSGAEPRSGIFSSRSAREPENPWITRSLMNGTRARARKAHAIWEAAWEPGGTPLARYLSGRGITLPIPPSLGWVPSLRRPDGTRGPAMVARVDAVDGCLIGVHRTWLDCEANGRWVRRDRASLGLIAGGAVRLAPMAETLMVGEGLETCLAAMHATGLPAWAALSTSGIIRLVLPPLPLAATVVILADNDHNGAGERAARVAAQRWLAEARRVRIAMPPEPGTDFNDVLSTDIPEARDAAA